MAVSIYTSDITSSSVLCHVIGLDTSYSRNDRTIGWYYNNIFFREDNLSAGASESGGCRITGLNASTTYTIKAIIYYTDNGTSLSKALTTSITTSAASATRPGAFSWTYIKRSGGAFNLTAAEWNAFCNNINEVRAYKGLSTISFTRAYSGNNFTASMFNQCRSAIYDINSSVGNVSTASSGGTIYAADLNNLVYYLNQVN